MAGLLDADYGDLNSLLAQFQPSEADKAAARKTAQLQFFLGMLGAPKGTEFAAIGQSGINALNNYQKQVQLEQALRNQNIQAATPLIHLAMQQQYAKQLGNILNGGGQQTVNGAPGAFQQPGGAASLMNQGTGGGAPAANTLPTQVQAPMDPQRQFDALNNANIMGMALGMPDMAPAINAKYPAPLALRQGAAAVDRFGNVINPNPAAPQGTYFDPKQGKFVRVPNASAEFAQSEAVPKAVDLAFKPPQPTVDAAGNETLPAGSALSQIYPGGQLPFNAPAPFTQAQAAPATPPRPAAQAAPSRVLKMGPEQTENAKELGQEAAGYRKAVSDSSKALAQLDELSGSLQYFTPGPTLPARAAAAGYAQEIPGVGRKMADKLVPNSAAALPAIAAMEKIGVGLTAEQSKVFGSREGQQVIGMIKSAMPNAAMVPGAPQVIIDAQKGLHQWIVDKGNAAQAYLSQNGTLNGFSNAWDQAHPVAQYVGNLPALQALARGQQPTAAPVAAAPAQSAAPNLQSVVDEMRRRGMIK